MIITIVSATKVIKRLWEPGTSRELRIKVLKRHFVYLAAYIIMVISFTIVSIWDLHEEGYSNKGGFDSFGDIYLYKPATIVYFAMGIIIVATRLLEPYVLQTIKESLGCLEKNNKLKYSEESLDSFLNSALNVDLVYMILVGVNNLYSADNKD